MTKADVRDDSAISRQAAGGIAGIAAILMVGGIASRALGLVREQLAAGYFGAGDAIAAFTIAEQLQTLVFDLLVSGALQAAMIPVLATLALPRDTSQADLRRVGGALVTWALMSTGMLAITGMLFASELVAGLAWLSGDTAPRGAGTQELAGELLLIVLPAAVLLGVAAVLQGLLHALGAVTMPALAAAARNAALIASMVLFSNAIGIESMAWGALAGAALIIVMQLVPLWRLHAMPVPNLEIRHPAVRRVGALYLPVLAGLAVNSVVVVVDRGLAWGAEPTAVGAMRYATTLVQLVLGLVAAALALASLPALSRHFAAGNDTQFDATMARVLGTVTVLILPATVGLAVFSGPVVRLLFEHGAMSADGTDAVRVALLGYLPGMLAAAFAQVLMFVSYARQNAVLPVVATAIGATVYFLVALPLVDRYGMVALVLGNSAMFIAQALVMGWAIGSLGVRPFGGRLRHTLQGAVAGTVVLGLILLAGNAVMGSGRGVWQELIRVAVPAVAGVAAYGVVLHQLRIEETRVVVHAVQKRFRRQKA